MKKLLIPSFLLLLLALIIVYLLLPSSYIQNKSVTIAANPSVLSRSLINQHSWRSWWPFPDSNRSDTAYAFDKYKLRITDQQFSSLTFQLSNGIDGTGQIILTPVTPTTSDFTWTVELKGNKFSTISSKRNMGKILDSVLTRVKRFYENPDNAYHVIIRAQHVMDSNLVSTSALFPQAPTPNDYYPLIDKLYQYIKESNAKFTGSPMLNILKEDGSYLTRVAIPVDRRLPGNGNISYKWMLGNGNILVADVEGGPHKIEEGFKELDWYARDNQRVAPAIPFQSLITDRRQQPDTNKWVTRLYYPVM